MCFAPILNTLRPLDPNLKYCQFSRFFDFWYLDFDDSTIEISTTFHLWVSNFFFQKVSSKNSSRKKMRSISRLILFSTSIFVFFLNFPYIDVWTNFHLWVYCTIFYGTRNFSSKSMESQLSNALSNTFIALLVAEIYSFQFQKLPQ